MITKCPHCNAKFKARDDLKGKKAKCPKCRQPFTIQEFLDESKLPPDKRDVVEEDVQVCAKCGKTIGKLEKSYPFKGVVVCAECDKKLRSSSVLQIVKMSKDTMCFFCGATAAESSVASINVCQLLAKHKKGSETIRTGLTVLGGALGYMAAGAQVEVLYRKRQVEVPRCPSCKEVHESTSAHYSKYLRRGALYGALAGTLAVIVVIARFGKNAVELGAGAIFAMLLVFVVLGLLIGLFLGYIVAKVTAKPWPEGVKHEKYGENYAGVKHMLEQGWEIRETPHTDETAVYAQLPPEGEEKMGIADVLDHTQAQEICALFLEKKENPD